MSEGEFGKFNFSGVHIDINRNRTECDVIATSLHELTHQILASSSSIGMLDFLLMNIYEVEKDIKLRDKIKQLYERVSKSSIKVQESTAVLIELLMLKSIDEKTYFSTLQMYDAGQIYMKEYGFEKLKFLLRIVKPESQDSETFRLNIANNIRNIAIKSMNIDLYETNPLDGKYMKCLDSNIDKYNANYRFKKVIQYIESNPQNIIFELTDKKIDDLFYINKLPVCSNFDWKKFIVWANDMICKPLGIKDVNEYINFVEKISVEEQLCSISAYNSSNVFKTKILNSEEEIKSSWTPDDIMYIQFENSYYRYILVNLDNKTQLLFFNKFALSNLAKEVKLLFMDRNHYDLNILKCPKLTQFDTFVDIGNMDSYARDFIKKENVVDYYIKKVNTNFGIIFFRGDFNTVFFLMYPLANIGILISKDFSDLILQASWWQDFIPEEKMEYFCKFIVAKE